MMSPLQLPILVATTAFCITFVASVLPNGLMSTPLLGVSATELSGPLAERLDHSALRRDEVELVSVSGVSDAKLWGTPAPGLGSNPFAPNVPAGGGAPATTGYSGVGDETTSTYSAPSTTYSSTRTTTAAATSRSTSSVQTSSSEVRTTSSSSSSSETTSSSSSSTTPVITSSAASVISSLAPAPSSTASAGSSNSNANGAPGLPSGLAPQTVAAGFISIVVAVIGATLL